MLNPSNPPFPCRLTANKGLLERASIQFRTLFFVFLSLRTLYYGWVLI